MPPFGEALFSCLKDARFPHDQLIVYMTAFQDNWLMSYIAYNPNPAGRNVGDCSVRAIAKALDVDWETAFMKTALTGLWMSDMPSSDSVWGAVLRENGFRRAAIPNRCPDCYTAEEFCRDHPRGVYVLAFGGHVATSVDGDLFDSWNSSQEIPVYYWHKED